MTNFYAFQWWVVVFELRRIRHADATVQDRDVHLEDYMGPGVDEKFDDILSSLGKVHLVHEK